ncbi:hypothetical protein K431DRAFT_282293 [Polychaeton citri CBS 116435]|uniref:Large ribosomal subunit protein bL28m n=1 Tax=Polychaeton citri CBS 116435 TaxID=1314669 RepID=A0A9P4QG06_9PEZI|nr:hypothetical protein K431DRAFT_282293 [Polychaeton citri CBS 116435]
MASVARRTINPARSCQRAFSTTSRRTASLQWDSNRAQDLADVVPAYPYGPAKWYKQQGKGLYGGQSIRFGNNVSDKFELKTRRSWHPNIEMKKLFSVALNRYVQVRVSTRVLRTIDKLGGLDEYLLGEKDGRIRELGESGWWLRWAIMQTPSVRRRFNEERTALGLPPKEDEGIMFVPTTPEEIDADAAVEAAEEGEVLSDDGTVTVQTQEGVPALRWRVGPSQHLILTDKGWRRIREDSSKAISRLEEKIAQNLEFANNTGVARFNSDFNGFNQLRLMHNDQVLAVRKIVDLDGRIGPDGEAYAEELKTLTASQRKVLAQKVVRKLRKSLAEELALAKHEKVLARRQQREGEAKAETLAADLLKAA